MPEVERLLAGREVVEISFDGREAGRSQKQVPFLLWPGLPVRE
jgi:hypothetical protein